MAGERDVQAGVAGGKAAVTGAIDGRPVAATEALSPAGRGSHAGRRYALLDVLRYVAALMVAVMHWGLELEGPYRSLYSLPIVGYLIRHGGLGVPIFFVISGFVILESATRAPGWRAFVFARVTRLFPGLFVCMAVVLAVGSHFINPYRTPVSSFVNSVFLTFTITHVQPLATQLWTLVVELKFYAAVALLLWIVPVIFRSRTGLIALIVVWQGLILSPALQPSSTTLAAVSSVVSLDFAAAYFLLGISVNLLMGLDRAIEVAVVPVVLVNAYFVREVLFRRLHGWEAVCVGCFTALIAISTRVKTTERARRTARILGSASYLMYLLHEQVGMAFLMEFRAHVTEHIQIAVIGAAAFVTAASIGLAMFIEQPIQRWLKRQVTMRPRLAPPRRHMLTPGS